MKSGCELQSGRQYTIDVPTTPPRRNIRRLRRADGLSAGHGEARTAVLHRAALGRPTGSRPHQAGRQGTRLHRQANTVVAVGRLIQFQRTTAVASRTTSVDSVLCRVATPTVPCMTRTKFITYLNNATNFPINIHFYRYSCLPAYV